MKRTKHPANILNANYSELVGRARLAAKLGSQYGGDRNIYRALGYKFELTIIDFAAQYDRQDIAKAIIDKPIAYTWKGDVWVSEGSGATETALEKAWVEMEDELNLKSRFVRLDKLTCLGRYGVLLLGFNDVATPEEFSQPVKKGVGRQLLYVKPLSEQYAVINEYVSNTSDKRFGLPLNYKIQYQDVVTARPMDLVVHYTRVIHIAQDQLESEVYGTPVLRSVYNRLQDLEKLVGASAEMFWRGARPGYQGIVDKESTITPEVEATLQDQFEEMENNLRRIIELEGIKLESLAMQIADPDKHVDIQLQMISAQTGIPKRILTGSERGELASSQDLTGWYTVIQSRRGEFADPAIIRPFVDRMIEYGVLPKAGKDGYTVQWEDLFSASDKEKADVGKVRASAIKEYATNLEAQYMIPPEAFMRFMLGLSEDEIEQIQAMRDSYIAEEVPVSEEEEEIIEEEETEEEENG